MSDQPKLTNDHPKKFEPTITTECNLCHGHFADGTPYLTLEMETFDGFNANLCGKCIKAMNLEVRLLERKKKGGTTE